MALISAAEGTPALVECRQRLVSEKLELRMSHAFIFAKSTSEAFVENRSEFTQMESGASRPLQVEYISTATFHQADEMFYIRMIDHS